MTVLTQSLAAGGEYHRPGRTYTRRRTVYAKRKALGLWDTYTRKGWKKRRRLTTNSLTRNLALREHQKRLDQLSWFKRQAKKRAHEKLRTIQLVKKKRRNFLLVPAK